MAGISNIEWTDAVWNPTTGCTRVSEGCRNCYAFQLHDMRHAAVLAGKKLAPQYAKPFKELQLFEDRLTTPLSWRKPRRIFVNSMSDLFHKDVPDEFIDKVFAAMICSPQHTFQILTKRPERMREYLSFTTGKGNVLARVIEAACAMPKPKGWVAGGGSQWPYRNVWLGTSVENQAAADERIPHLLRTPAAVRFLSCEPLLGSLDLTRSCHPWGEGGASASMLSRIHWVIVGGESGPGARACDVAWIRSIVEQCKAAGVSVFVKQLGSSPIDMELAKLVPGSQAKRSGPATAEDAEVLGKIFDVIQLDLRDKKGGDMAEWPACLQVREFPKAAVAA